MKIVYLKIVNFKSIRDLEINDMENSLILVGKNSTGKTSVIDAVLSAAGLRQVYANEFLEPGKPIEISMKISFTDEDLQYYYTKGILSKIRNYEKWLEDREYLFSIHSLENDINKGKRLYNCSIENKCVKVGNTIFDDNPREVARGVCNFLANNNPETQNYNIGWHPNYKNLLNEVNND